MNMETLSFEEKKMKFTRTLLLVFAVALILPFILNVRNSAAKVINGPYEAYGNVTLRNVHIVSNSYGIIVHGHLTLINSKISAPDCIKVSSGSVYLQGNYFNCDLGVKYMSMPIGDDLINNTFAGRISNSSDFSSGAAVPGMGSPFPFMP